MGILFSQCKRGCHNWLRVNRSHVVMRQWHLGEHFYHFCSRIFVGFGSCECTPGISTVAIDVRDKFSEFYFWVLLNGTRFELWFPFSDSFVELEINAKDARDLIFESWEITSNFDLTFPIDLQSWNSNGFDRCTRYSWCRFANFSDC